LKRFYRYSILFFTLISYSSVFLAPDIFWISGFISLTIPVVIFYHFLGILIFRKRSKTNFILHIILFVIGFPFLKMTFQLSNWSEIPENSFKVLSYNVRVFNNYAHLNENYVSSKKMINWALGDDSPIKCFQEFYNRDASEIFNVRNRLINNGWKYDFFKIRFEDKDNGQFGQAIFCKFPIIGKGEIFDDKGEFMNTIYVDVKRDEDTIRIYCIHLESMAIDEENIVNTEKIKKTYIDTGYRLRNGFISRAKQVDALIKNVLKCPYPIIICGDINEMPYSYTYCTIRRQLNNAFEAKGKGFGFSYNGKLFFLRIDNQFFSDDLEIKKFETHRQADQSDHFPITSVYSVK